MQLLIYLTLLEQSFFKNIAPSKSKALQNFANLKAGTIESEELTSFIKLSENQKFSLKDNIPNRQIFPDISNYAHLVDGSNNLIAGSVETTYGCKHSCTHCPVPISFNGSFKTYSLEKIVNDVQNQVIQGAEHISFNDPDFFNGPIHALKILEALNHKFPKITYDSTIKV